MVRRIFNLAPFEGPLSVTCPACGMKAGDMCIDPAREPLRSPGTKGKISPKEAKAMGLRKSFHDTRIARAAKKEI